MKLITSPLRLFILFALTVGLASPGVALAEIDATYRMRYRQLMEAGGREVSNVTEVILNARYTRTTREGADTWELLDKNAGLLYMVHDRRKAVMSLGAEKTRQEMLNRVAMYLEPGPMQQGKLVPRDPVLAKTRRKKTIGDYKAVGYALNASPGPGGGETILWFTKDLPFHEKFEEVFLATFGDFVPGMSELAAKLGEAEGWLVGFETTFKMREGEMKTSVTYLDIEKLENPPKESFEIPDSYKVE